MDKEMLEAMRAMFDERDEKMRAIITENNQTLKQELREEMSQMMDAKLERHDTRVINQVNAIIESKVMPAIQTVAERHGEIIDRIKRVEARRETSQALRSHVRTLEDVVRSHTERIEALEAKAE